MEILVDCLKLPKTSFPSATSFRNEVFRASTRDRSKEQSWSPKINFPQNMASISVCFSELFSENEIHFLIWLSSSWYLLCCHLKWKCFSTSTEHIFNILSVFKQMNSVMDFPEHNFWTNERDKDDETTCSVNKGMKVDKIYLVFSKALDTVSQRIFSSYLETYGLCAWKTSWTTSLKEFKIKW